MTMHPYQALTPFKIRALKKPGRYADGNGLYLHVDDGGAKRWVLRTMVQGRRRDIGLGSVRLVTLSEARDAARLYRKIARDGGDPPRRAPEGTPDRTQLRGAARAVHRQNAPAWRNPKHKDPMDQFSNRICVSDYRGPADRSDRAPDVLRVLAPFGLPKLRPRAGKTTPPRGCSIGPKHPGFAAATTPLMASPKACPSSRSGSPSCGLGLWRGAQFHSQPARQFGRRAG